MDARLLMDSPRDRLVEAAIQGLRASGLAGAGVNQVIAASGAPKGSLYHYFPGGKLQLAQEAIERFGDERNAALAKAMAGDEPPSGKIVKLFAAMARALAREKFQAGCAVAGVALDLQPDSEALAPVCAAQFERWAETLAAGLGPLAPARRLVWARQVITTFEGALIQARAQRSTQPLLAAGEMLAASLQLEASST